MFPFKIRVLGDEEHPAEVWMNRKKVASFRPSYVAGTVKASQDRLYNANFKVTPFMNELAEAYETCRARENIRKGANIALTKIYRYLAPTARAKKDYDSQAFAFDLAKAYEEGPENWVTKSGMKFTFGTSRDGSGIRVLSKTGKETYISTLRPIHEGDE